MTWLLALPAKLKAILAISGAAIVAIGIAFLKGRAEGIRHLEAEQARRRIEAMKDRKEIDDEVSGMDATALDTELTRWMRDNPDR
jgi:hypothetical protein